MKLLFVFCALLTLQNTFAQSADYLSLRNKNGGTIKNYYAGSQVLFQLIDGSYRQGVLQTLRNDSVYLKISDVRLYPTNWGTYVKDTISVFVQAFHYTEIMRIHRTRRRGFFERRAAPLMMIGGGGYVVLNVINGGSLTDKDNQRRLATAAGFFGLGYLLQRLFKSDGFSKPNNRLVYVDL